jgi:hypothetical protein
MCEWAPFIAEKCPACDGELESLGGLAGDCVQCIDCGKGGNIDVEDGEV